MYIYVFTLFWYQNIEIARKLLQGKFDSSTRQRMFELYREKFDEYLNGTEIAKNIPVDVLISAVQGS